MTNDTIERPNKTNKGHYAQVNGLNLYHEIHGRGNPLILLHGGFGTVEMFEQVLPGLAETRQVIAVELQGHGHTADIDRPLSFEQLADDIAALIQHLGLEKSDILGYSLGGSVALQTAIRHPDVVRKLVVVSAPFKSEGWYPEVRAGLKTINGEVAKTWVGSPMHQAYINAAPNPENWPMLADKIGQSAGQEYDWSTAVSAIKTPTMIIMGDADGINPAHAVEFFQLLGGGMRDAGWDGSGMSNAQLAILPGTTHYNILFSPMFVSAVIPFLDAPMPKTI